MPDPASSRNAEVPEPASRLAETCPSSSGPGPGDRQHFADFYRGHLRRLVAYLLYLGASAHLAAEIAQDAMAEVYKRWATIDSPRSYTWQVAGRAYGRRTVDAEVLVADVPEPTAVLPHPHAAEVWIQKQYVLNVLRALPLRQRQRQVAAVPARSPRRAGPIPAAFAAMSGVNLLSAQADNHAGHRDSGEQRRVLPGGIG